MMKCPGQDTRYWKPGAIFTVPCPKCGRDVEFFKDEATRRCRHCREKVVNPKMDFACAAHCRFAEQCLGELPPELVSQRDDLLKDRVAVEMKRYFGPDFQKIRHASRVAQHTDELVRVEQGDSAIVLTAAYLHEVGGLKPVDTDDQKREAEERCKSCVGAVRQILENLGARRDLVEAVCEIIGHLNQPGIGETINFKIVHDADLMAQLEEEKSSAPISADRAVRWVEQSFMTKTGCELARRFLMERDRKS
jgi:HD superfamily phosphodiesterase